MFGTNFSEITSCYKVFPSRLVPKLVLLPNNDFVYDAVELTYVLLREGIIVEVPISYTARRRKEGKKLNWRHGLKCIWAITRIKLQRKNFPVAESTVS